MRGLIESAWSQRLGLLGLAAVMLRAEFPPPR